jgi:predicted metal-dependent hydrolase
MIATVEHMTAVLGDWILNADLDGLGADPVMTDLFRWHGAEEVEHRSVAHDVATYFGVGYLHRNLLIAPSPFAVLFLFLRNTKYLCRQDHSLPNYGYPRLVVEWIRASRRGSLPGPRALFSAWSYLRPSFTPEEVGNTAQAVAYLARSPAVKQAAG